MADPSSVAASSALWRIVSRHGGVHEDGDDGDVGGGFLSAAAWRLVIPMTFLVGRFFCPCSRNRAGCFPVGLLCCWVIWGRRWCLWRLIPLSWRRYGPRPLLAWTFSDLGAHLVMCRLMWLQNCMLLLRKLLRGDGFGCKLQTWRSLRR